MATDFDPWLSAAIATEVMTMGQATPAAVQACRDRRLATLVERARRDTRLHADRLRGIDAGAPLESLPVLDKGELMARFDDSVADPMLRWPVVHEFMADPSNIGLPLLGRYVVWESSGTGTQPGVFVQDPTAMAVYDALEALRPRPRASLPGLPGFAPRVAFVGAIDGHFASQATMQRLRRLNPWMAVSLRSFSIMQPIDRLVAQLNDWAPSALASYPTAAALLADEQLRGALRLHLVDVMTGGETLAAGQRAHIESAFGCVVRNSYGTSEFLAVASQCAAGRLHLNADWVIVEPVDAQGRPVPVGELSHTALVTNLANAVQPLIRCDIGDRVRVLPGRCSCGSPLPAIEVHGRQDDALPMSGGKGRAVTLLPMALCTVLEEDAGVFDFQIVRRDARTLALRLGPGAAATPELAAISFARCRDVLRRFAHEQGVSALRVVEERGVPPQAGRSGKVRRVVAG